MFVKVSDHLSEWEDPERIDGRVREVVRDAAALKNAVDEMAGDWKSIANTYEGERKQELVDAMQGTAEEAEDLFDHAKDIDDIMWDFVVALQGLHERRAVLEAEADEVNAAASGAIEPQAVTTAQQQCTALSGRLDALEADYQTAVEDCVSALGRVSAGTKLMGEKAADFADWWNGWIGQTVWGGMVGMVGGTRAFHVTHGASGSPLRQNFGTTHVTYMGVDVEVLRERARLVGPFARALAQSGAGIVGILPAASRTVFDVVRGGGWHPVQQVRGLVSGAKDAAAALRGAGGIVDPLHGVFESWGNATRDGMTPGVNKALAVAGVAEPKTGEMSKAQLKAVADAKPSFWTRFRSGVVGGLPITGTITALKEHEGLQKKIGSVDIKETGKWTRGLSTASKVGGPVTTAISGVLTFNDEKGKVTDKLRDTAEFQGKSEAEIEAEANQRAGAQTVGNVGTSLLAAAAGGAVAGSVVPGPGTAVGFLGGLAGAALVSVPVADTDGDGEKDSVAEMGGDLAEGAWNGIRDGAGWAWGKLTGR